MQTRLIEQTLEIARKRRRILMEMQAAIRANDKDQVFALARELTGLSNEERHRTNSRIN
jgi:hypothetical protein